MSGNKVIIDGKEYFLNKETKTVLNFCREQAIDIPNFCYDERLTPYGSCWMCIVQIKKRKGVVPACSTIIEPNMEITTNNELIRVLRKTNLELLFSTHYGDCYPPCKLTCPSNLDIQGYIALINRKEYKEALKLIKEDCTMPATIGRICPRPCETKCRRELVDEPVAIDYLKKFVADLDMKSDSPYVPVKESPKNKKIAIIGAGPAGLSCAYYLSIKGYESDIYDMMPKAGGMLRYGIPDYRLSKEVLDKEIEIILKTGGINIFNNKKLGKDITIQSLQAAGYKAIFLATGAWISNKMNIPGEELKGIYQGIDFLIDFALGKIKKAGNKVAIIGGGNTAIDTARTSVRFGAEKVYIIYRRTEKEMPAAPIEIEEAYEEGIEFIFLTNPVKYIGDGNGNVQAIECIRMELGEPDASGRRRPVPVKDSEYCIEVDMVIESIGQKVETSFIDKEIELSRWNTISINEETYKTNKEGIFAGGDAVSGPDIAIKAINAGKTSAKSISNYLESKTKSIPKLFSITKDTYFNLCSDEYQKYPKLNRNNIDKIDPDIRRKNFKEVEKPYTEEKAKNETMRCLSCGCLDVNECKLKMYGEEYLPDFTKYAGEIKKHPIDIAHQYITRDNNKCINCGKCVRICLEYQGPGAFGYIFRGFESVINPKFNSSLKSSECTSCGQCITICPTGALMEKIPGGKPGPFKTEKIESTCYECSLKCETEIETVNNQIIKIRGKKKSDNNYGLLCSIGKFSFIKEKLNLQNLKKEYIMNNECKERYHEFRQVAKKDSLSKKNVLESNFIIFIGEDYKSPDYEVIFKETENRKNTQIISVYKNNNPYDKEKIETSIELKEFTFNNIRKILDKYKHYILLFDFNKINFRKEIAEYINERNIDYYLVYR